MRYAATELFEATNMINVTVIDISDFNAPAIDSNDHSADFDGRYEFEYFNEETNSWEPYEEGDILDPGKYQVRVKGDETHPAGDAFTVTIPKYENPHTGDEIENHSTGDINIIWNVSTGMEYSYEDEDIWCPIDDSNEHWRSFDIEGENEEDENEEIMEFSTIAKTVSQDQVFSGTLIKLPAGTYHLRYAENTFYEASDIGDIIVYDVPAPEGIRGGENIITGTNGLMEYRKINKDDSNEWKPVQKDPEKQTDKKKTLSGLSTGKYEVRYMETEYTLPSQSIVVKVSDRAETDSSNSSKDTNSTDTGSSASSSSAAPSAQVQKQAQAHEHDFELIAYVVPTYTAEGMAQYRCRACEQETVITFSRLYADDSSIPDPSGNVYFIDPAPGAAFVATDDKGNETVIRGEIRNEDPEATEEILEEIREKTDEHSDEKTDEKSRKNVHDEAQAENEEMNSERHVDLWWLWIILAIAAVLSGTVIYWKKTGKTSD